MDDKLRRNWENHYKACGINPDMISIDGIVSEKEFGKDLDNNPAKRLLFVFKDTNDFRPGRTIEERDLRSFVREGPFYPMWHTVARWTWALLNPHVPYEKMPYNDKNQLNQALRRIAVVNIKKATGRGWVDKELVHIYARLDQKLLIEQINNINPDIIVAGGVISPLFWLLNPDVPEFSELGILPDKYLSSPIKWGRRWIFPMRHPVRADQAETYEQIRSMILSI